MVILSETFRSNRERLSALPVELENLRPQCKMTDLSFHHLVLAMTEAVVNAIVHGNREDPSKLVKMEISCEWDGIHCSVADQGSGFEPKEVADPVAPENLLKDGGRGVFIIQAVSTASEIRSGPEGTTISFTIDRNLGIDDDGDA